MAALLVMLLVPFHAFVTVWASSLVGHYTALRLWKEVILLFCALGTLYLVLTDNKIRTQTLTRRLVWLIIVYGVITVLWAIVAYEHHAVSLKAAAYGCLLNLRFLAFFMITWALALRTSRMRVRWQRLILIPALIVVVIGLLQALILPHDILRHFGYGAATIPVNETINHNAAFLRIQSTLRGANPLGAYLLIPAGVLMYYVYKRPRDWRLWAFFAGTILTLFFTFSRSAWLGFALMAICMAGLLYSKSVPKRWLYIFAAGAILLSGVLILSVHSNTKLENIVLHTQTHSAVATTSDQGHLTAFKEGTHDLIHEPLGRGPGSAGPASVYNNHPGRIAENYYIQIGQEVGWLGLGIFLLIQAGVGYLLWLRRVEPLALCLFASFIGLSAVNMLSHAWTDDTLAYLWWGLAGIAMAPAVLEKHNPKKKK